MTSYHGGKQKIGKKLANIIYDFSVNKDETDFNIEGYCEPFCGMLGVYQHIPELFKDYKLTYQAGDINESVIKMWKSVYKGWIPPKSCSRETFNLIKYDGKTSNIKGFIGHQCTYRGVFLDSYFNKPNSAIKKASENISNISNKLNNISFSSKNYTQYSNLENYIIYCDPPYANTEQRYYKGDGYVNKLSFDNTEFLIWCRKMSKNNIIFMSEYNAPSDFKKIYTNKKEKLYYLE